MIEQAFTEFSEQWPHRPPFSPIRPQTDRLICRFFFPWIQGYVSLFLCKFLQGRYLRILTKLSGRHTFSRLVASLNSGAISLSLKPAMPQPMRVT